MFMQSLIAAPLAAAAFLAVGAHAAPNDFVFDSGAPGIGAVFQTFKDSGRGLAATARETDPALLEIDLDSVEITETGASFAPLSNPPGGGDPDSVRVTLPVMPEKPGKPGDPKNPYPGPGGSTVTPERIVNIGKSIWDFIKESKPVIETAKLYANAVPLGVSDWTQLGGWGAPESTFYTFSAKNKGGAKVVEVTYMILRTGRGNYKGTGQYLTGVTAIPVSISVGWGYKFTMGLEVPSVSNIGSVERPVAGMTLNVHWTIENNFKATRGSGIYYLTGEGLFKQIAAPAGVTEVK